VTVLQLIALVAVTLGGTAVVLTPEPLRQAMVLGIFGFALTFLFFVFQAPDVALSEIVVSGVGIPLIVLAALRKIRQQEDPDNADRDEGSER
jgi:energy-converting hydrogenase B subunit D